MLRPLPEGGCSPRAPHYPNTRGVRKLAFSLTPVTGPTTIGPASARQIVCPTLEFAQTVSRNSVKFSLSRSRSWLSHIAIK